MNTEVFYNTVGRNEHVFHVRAYEEVEVVNVFKKG